MKIPFKMQKRKSFGIHSRRMIWLLAMVMSMQLMYAQAPQQITGTVTDDTGETLPGANVVVAGTTTGTMTDLDGKFSIMAPEGASLQVSFTGFITQTVKVGTNRNLTVILRESPQELREVVVTAMGITREAKSLSYAHQSIDVESMRDSRASNLLDMLSGKVAGLQVIPGGGPLASTRIVMRGNNSLTGNNQPLYVVDGVPFLNPNNGDGEGELDYGSAVNSINPDEIENIEFLKGANASALYGSDAANGVILITTKKATRKQGLGISYNFNLMFGTLLTYPTYQNIYGAGQNGRFEREGARNLYGNSGYGNRFDPDLPYGIWNPNMAAQDQRSFGMPMLGFDVIGRNGEIKSFSPQKNNVKSMYRTSTSMTNSFSVDKVRDYASLRFSYVNIHSDDILKNFNKLDRHNFSLRSTAKLADFLDVDMNVRYIFEDVDNRNYRNNTNRNPLHMIMYMPRDISLEELVPWKRADGTSMSYAGFTNPYWMLNETSNHDEKHSFMGNITFNITLPYNLKVRLRAATDMNSNNAWDFANKYTPNLNNQGGYYSRSSQTWRNNNFDGLISYNKRFEERYSLSANVGTSVQKIKMERMRSWINQLRYSDIKSLNNRNADVMAQENFEKKEKQAVYGMASFGFDDWLYLDATARNEWSSSLPTSNNSYFYYSFGTGIILSDIFEVDKNILSFAKLRGSYAQVGNDTGYNRLFNGYTLYTDGTYLGMPYYQGSSTRNNPKIKPEKTQSWELGTDLRFWDNRVSLDLTYYSKRTTDQIVVADAPLASGYQREIINAGEIKNHGAEITLSITPIQTSDWSWTTTVNWSQNKSKVVSLSEGVTRFQMGSGNNIQSYAEVGKPYGVFYGNQYRYNEEGLIQSQWDLKALFDTDVYLGTIEPKWFGGWINSVRFKDFDFGMMIDFQKGGRVWSMTAWQGARDGQTVQTLEGRYEWLHSRIIMGENNEEIRGILNNANTVYPADQYANYVLYPDWQRPKGVKYGNTVYGKDQTYWGQLEDEDGNLLWIPTIGWVNPMDHWVHNNGSSAARYIYDASYIKLREINLGYTIPRKYLRNTPLGSVRVSAVGRNLAVIHQNTPKGLDPQATSTTGNNQGFEKGFNLMQANYGFDIKVTF